MDLTDRPGSGCALEDVADVMAALMPSARRRLRHRPLSSTPATTMTNTLPDFDSVLVVCAHPDDESFGLGAILSTLAKVGTHISVLCFTHGEASTLHAAAGDLHTLRAAELEAAGERLGVTRVELLDYPDGALNAQPLDDLAEHIRRLAAEVEPAVLLVFDQGGITSQSADNPVLWKRLDLLGPSEHLRYLDEEPVEQGASVEVMAVVGFGWSQAINQSGTTNPRDLCP